VGLRQCLERGKWHFPETVRTAASASHPSSPSIGNKAKPCAKLSTENPSFTGEGPCSPLAWKPSARDNRCVAAPRQGAFVPSLPGWPDRAGAGLAATSSSWRASLQPAGPS